MTDQRFTKLLDRANSKPTTKTVWKPKDGDTLVGVIESFETFDHPSYGTQHLVNVEVEKGHIVQAFLNSHLQKELKGMEASAGDALLLRFEGQETSVTGSKFNKYLVLLEK